MDPNPGSHSESLLGRLDEWNRAGKWLEDKEEAFPPAVFWGIFIWNFPILAIAFGIIGVLFYRSDPDPNGYGLFTHFGWLTELILTTGTLTALIDLAACLWLRRLWNKRARSLRQEV